MTSRQILDALKVRHSPPEWAGFSELRDGAGFASKRSLDFWAMNTWPSKGLRVVAYEIKVSRGDFMKEIQNPKKRESAECFSHESYFAAPTGLLKVEEIPEGWGLVEVSETGTTRAKKLATQRKNVDFDDHFVAVLLRRSSEKEAELLKKSVMVEEMEVAAADWPKFIREKVDLLFEATKPALMWSARQEIENEILAKYGGDELDDLKAILKKEVGWPYREEADTIPKAVRELLCRLRGEKFGDEDRDLLRTITSLELSIRQVTDYASRIKEKIGPQTNGSRKE